MRRRWGGNMLIVVYGLLSVVLVVATINSLDDAGGGVSGWLLWHAVVLILAVLGRVRLRES